MRVTKWQLCLAYRRGWLSGIDGQSEDLIANEEESFRATWREGYHRGINLRLEMFAETGKRYALRRGTEKFMVEEPLAERPTREEYDRQVARVKLLEQRSDAAVDHLRGRADANG